MQYFIFCTNGASEHRLVKLLVSEGLCPSCMHLTSICGSFAHLARDAMVRIVSFAPYSRNLFLRITDAFHLICAIQSCYSCAYKFCSSYLNLPYSTARIVVHTPENFGSPTPWYVRLLLLKRNCSPQYCIRGVPVRISFEPLV